jgi:hypothetical protein
MDLPVPNFLEEIRERDGGRTALEPSGEAPDHDPHADEDDPEQ